MITYLIKMVIVSGLLLFAYHFLLAKEKTYYYNRFYLLFSILLSVVVPFIEIKWQREDAMLSKPVEAINEVWEIAGDSFQAVPIATQDGSSMLSPALTIYLIITCVFLLRFCWNLFSVLRQAKQNDVEQHQNSKLVLLKNKCLPYSFLNYVFVSKEQKQTAGLKPEILYHELTHVRQKHSWDVLFVEIVLVFAWLNPFFFLYKKAIRLNHEFMADDAVIKTFPDRRSYQYLLLNTSVNSTPSSITSSFNYITIKKRLTMMPKTTSRQKAFLLKAVTTFCLIAVLFLVGAKSIAQHITGNNDKPKPSVEKKDTVMPLALVGIPIGSTKEGVSEELLTEYGALVEKYFGGQKSGAENWDRITREDKARMEQIFKQMNPEQQNKQKVAFLKPPKPLPKVVPTKEQFTKFKNSKLYGVWIDEKKVANEELLRYSNTDFSQVFISKLHGAAKKGRNYTHQVDLITNEFYKKYYTEALQNNTSTMVFRSRIKPKNGNE